MDMPHIESVVERLGRLERENRRWRLATLAMVLCAALALAVGGARNPDDSKTFEAERFQLRDREGRVRLVMDARGEGSPILALFDKDKKQRLVMSVSSEGMPSLSLLDNDGKLRYSTRLGVDGAPSLGLADRNGIRAFLELGKDGAPSLSFADVSGRPRILLKNNSESGSEIALVGKGGEGEIALGFVEGTTPVMYVKGGHDGTGMSLNVRDGRPTLRLGGGRDQGDVSLAITPDGFPFFGLTDKGKQLRVLLGVNPTVRLASQSRTRRVSPKSCWGLAQTVPPWYRGLSKVGFFVTSPSDGTPGL